MSLSWMWMVVVVQEWWLCVTWLRREVGTYYRHGVEREVICQLVYWVVHSGMCCLARLFSGGGQGWGELLIDGGNWFHDEVKGCLLVGDKHCLLFFEVGREGVKLIKGVFHWCFKGILGCFNCCLLLCELRKKLFDSGGVFLGQVWWGYCWADGDWLGGLGSLRGAESGCVGFLVAVGVIVDSWWCGVGRYEACVIAVKVIMVLSPACGNSFG